MAPFLELFSQDQYQPGKMIAKFRTGIVNIPFGETSVTPDEQTINDENLLSILNGIGTTILDKLIPWSAQGDSTITSPITGEQAIIHNWTQVFLINFDEQQDVNAAVTQMNQLESVIYAEPNPIANLDATPNDPRFNEQWYLLNNVNNKFDIDAVSGWDYSKGDNIIIGIIDTGSDVLHEDLTNHIWTGGGSETGTPSGNHGTYVAGIAAAVTNNNKGVAGIGWNSWLMPRDFGSGYLSDVVADILDASVNNGAHVLNCSWHYMTDYTSLRNAIEDAFNVGSNFVASMGNKLPSDPPYVAYPAAYNNWVIAVGALLKVNNGDTLYARPDMNYGSFIDVTAPGDSLRTTQWKTTDPNNHSRYAWFGMTSAAAPVVSGITALVRAEFPNKSNAEVMDIIRNSAVLFNGWENDFNHYGYGMVNAFFAVAPPDAPQNLEISIVGANDNPRLDWDANSEPDLKEYVVYRKINQGNWVEKARTMNTYYIDTSIEDAEIYASAFADMISYAVTAIDYTDLESGYSNTVRCFIPGGPPPSKRYAGDTGTETDIPKEFVLLGNYPNPFNPQTTIKFGLPVESKVHITVYNIRGELVATIINHKISAGYHQVVFDATNLSSGIYLYRIQAGEFTQVRRMLLIK